MGSEAGRMAMKCSFKANDAPCTQRSNEMDDNYGIVDVYDSPPGLTILKSKFVFF